MLAACTSVRSIPANERTAYFMCFEQDKSTKHYFINTFATEPTTKKKQNEVLLVKHRMEKQLQVVLIDCQEITESEVPKDLDI